MKYVFLYSFLLFSYCCFSQSLVGKDITITHDGAEFIIDDHTVKGSSVIIPKGSKLIVLKERWSNQSSGEADEIKEISFRVKFKDKTGWVNGSNTNYMTIPVEVKPDEVKITNLKGAKFIDKNLVIPYGMALKVISMKVDIDQKTKINHYLFKVSYAGYNGWINGSDTNNPQLDY